MHNFSLQWWSCLKNCSSSIYLMTFIKNFLILLWVIFKLGNNKNKVHNGRKKLPSPLPLFLKKYNYFLGSINEEVWEYRHYSVRNNNKPMAIICVLIMSNCMVYFFLHNTCITHTVIATDMAPLFYWFKYPFASPSSTGSMRSLL